MAAFVGLRSCARAGASVAARAATRFPLSAVVAASTVSVVPSLVRARAFAAAAGAESYVALDESKQSLDDLIKQNDKLIAYFTASWCGPCRMIAPVFSSLALENVAAVKFVKVDVDDNAATAEQAEIRSVPTFKAYSGGKLVREFSGANTESLKSTVGLLTGK